VSDGVVVADGASGSVYANTCSSKAASRVRFADKNYYMTGTEQSALKSTKKGTLEISLPEVSKISGYMVEVSSSKSFAKDVQTYRLKKTETTAVIEGLAAKKKYYVRVYSYKTYKGVKIYKCIKG
jgi:hypothetical protein